MWYVIQVRTGHEDEVAGKCGRVLKAGESVFTMLSERRERVGGEWQTVVNVAFKGYVFAETDDIGSLRIRLHSISDLTKIVSVGDDMVPIYEEEEEMLRFLGGDDHVIRLSRGFSEGDSIAVTEGPLKGLESKIKWVDRRQKTVGISFTLFDRIVDVKLGAEFIRPAKNSNRKPENPEDE